MYNILYNSKFNQYLDHLFCQFSQQKYFRGKGPENKSHLTTEAEYF